MPRTFDLFSKLKKLVIALNWDLTYVKIEFQYEEACDNENELSKNGLENGLENGLSHSEPIVVSSYFLFLN